MTGLVSLEMDDEDQLDYPMPMPMAERPRYPCGTIISLRRPELEKLKLEADCEPGDYLYLKVEAKVLNVSRGEEDDCVSLQIEAAEHYDPQE